MGQKRDVIVIGASEGGLKALCILVAALPASLAAAILIVLHTKASSPPVDQIISGHSKLPVSYGKQDELIETGRIYLASPNLHLTVAASGRIVLHAGETVDFHRPAADNLFKSAAAAYGHRVIGILLSGNGDDGSEGILTIHRAGGINLIQEPMDAVAPSMPLNAIIKDHPDYIVALDKMAPHLERLVKNRAVKWDQ